MTHALRALALAALLAVGTVPGGRTAAELDEMSKLIVGYDLSAPTAQQVARFWEAMARWAKANAKEVAELQRQEKGSSLDVAIARFEGHAALRKLLDVEGIRARDAILAPLALAQSGAVAMAEERGVQMPAEAVNRKNVALVKRDKSAMEALLKRITDARATLGPGR